RITPPVPPPQFPSQPTFQISLLPHSSTESLPSVPPPQFPNRQPPPTFTLTTNLPHRILKSDFRKDSRDRKDEQESRHQPPDLSHCR
ncbi:unnamed protein product, partial [Linum tenue]